MALPTIPCHLQSAISTVLSPQLPPRRTPLLRAVPQRFSTPFQFCGVPRSHVPRHGFS